jgi:hypothetical protein
VALDSWEFTSSSAGDSTSPTAYEPTRSTPASRPVATFAAGMPPFLSFHWLECATRCPQVYINEQEEIYIYGTVCVSTLMFMSLEPLVHEAPASFFPETLGLRGAKGCSRSRTDLSRSTTSRNIPVAL